MGIKTWKIGAKAAGTHVRGQVTVASPSGDLDGFGKDVGTEVVDAINQAAKRWRPTRDRQPESGEAAKDLASITVTTAAPLLVMQEAKTVESMGGAAGLMADIVREALFLEPRFIGAYALAVTARERADAGYLHLARELTQAITSALPQPIQRAGEVDRVMRVELQDVAFPKPGSRLKDAGLAQVEFSVKCDEVDGREVDKRSSTVYFPLPLSGPAQPARALFVEMWVGEVQVIVELETKRPAYGALRALVFAVEEVVEDFRFDFEGLLLA